MAFSFNPGQIAPPNGQASASPPLSGIGIPGAPSPVLSSNPASPFLFMHDRDKPMTNMAYAQIIMMVVCAMSIIVAAVLFSYNLYLTSAIKDKKALLDQKEAEFPDYKFAEIARLSNRMAAISTLLKNYISPRSPLKFLENVVENKVVFNDFSLTQSSNALGYTIDFTVITGSYSALIQQLAALNLKEYNKVAPQPKSSSFVDSNTLVKIKVSTPVFVQGVLPDEIVFIDPSATINTKVIPVVSSSSTSVSSGGTPQ